MKKETTIYRLIIVLLIIANIYLIFSKNKLSTNFSKFVENKQNENSYEGTLFSELYEAAIESNGILINKDIELFNVQNETIKLENLVKQHSIVVFDFTHISCKTCFEDELNRIVKLSDDFGKENIILISDFSSIREQYVIENQYGLKAFDKQDNEFGLPIEHEQYPYIYIIDTNCIARDFYIPTQQFFSLGNIYYKIIYEKYFNP
jgi:hypothetical protein